MKIKYYQQALLEGLRLSHEEAKELCTLILSPELEPVKVGAILSLLAARPLEIEEVLGFRDALYETKIDLNLNYDKAVDVCGTGGDGKNFFNISTTSSFVVAAAGVPVVKHGNHGVSSSCGSSTVLEALGYQFTTLEGTLQKQLDKVGITFLHAPLFYPSLKHIGIVRRALGVKTIFNILGPLLNPAGVPLQVTGVYGSDVQRLYQEVLKEITEDYFVVYSYDGSDEISLLSPARIVGRDREVFIEEDKETELGRLKFLNEEDLKSPGNAKQAGALLVSVLKGEGTFAQNQVVACNSALAISLFKQCSLISAKAEADEIISSAKGYKVLKDLLECQ